MNTKPAVLLAGLLLMTAAVAVAPAASAHYCEGPDCGPCIPGQDHEHIRNSSACKTRALPVPPLPPLPPALQDVVDIILGE